MPPLVDETVSIAEMLSNCVNALSKNEYEIDAGLFSYAFFYGTVRIKQIFLTYFTTVVILTIFNRLFGIRASGHAASSVSPCVFSFSFGYVFAGTLFAIFFGMSVWASLYLQRHKVRDVAMGAVSFFIAFVLAYVYTGFMI